LGDLSKRRKCCSFLLTFGDFLEKIPIASQLPECVLPFSTLQAAPTSLFLPDTLPVTTPSGLNYNFESSLPNSAGDSDFFLPRPFPSAASTAPSRKVSRIRVLCSVGFFTGVEFPFGPVLPVTLLLLKACSFRFIEMAWVCPTFFILKFPSSCAPPLPFVVFPLLTRLL